MHRQQPATTALRRQLVAALAMLLFAGLGLCQTGHCADHLPGHGAASSIDQPARLTVRHSPDSTAEDCHVRTSAGVASTVTTVAMPAPVRTNGSLTPDGAAAAPPHRPAGVTLTAIGVSRT